MGLPCLRPDGDVQIRLILKAVFADVVSSCCLFGRLWVTTYSKAETAISVATTVKHYCYGCHYGNYWYCFCFSVTSLTVITNIHCCEKQFAVYLMMFMKMKVMMIMAMVMLMMMIIIMMMTVSTVQALQEKTRPPRPEALWLSIARFRACATVRASEVLSQFVSGNWTHTCQRTSSEEHVMPPRQRDSSNHGSQWQLLGLGTDWPSLENSGLRNWDHWLEKWRVLDEEIPVAG